MISISIQIRADLTPTELADFLYDLGTCCTPYGATIESTDSIDLEELPDFNAPIKEDVPLLLESRTEDTCACEV